MPFIPTRTPPFKAAKDIDIKWENFKRGLNLIFKPTELRDDELAQADNAMLVGEGVPTGRWGSEVYNLAGSTGQHRFLGAYYKSTASLNKLLSITDEGLLNVRSGASYTTITGASFPSGTDVTGVELGFNEYFAGGPSRTFVKYDGTSLIPFDAIDAPTNVLVSNLSGATGTTEWSWRITANSKAGETIGSTAKSLVSLPLDLSTTKMLITWTATSAASGTLKGYNIYRGLPGDETWISTVGPESTTFTDIGDPQSDTIFPPTSDQTSGPRARYIIKFDDRLVVAGFDGDPSLVQISARFPFQERFNWADGGGFTRVDPDGGDDITGLGIADSQGSSQTSASILVFKENSVHRVVVSSITIGNFSVLDPQVQLLTSSNGCSSHRSVVAVENDTFYFGNKGLYTVGQEPNFLNQIRTNEISARIRPYIKNLSKADFEAANAVYLDNKYIISFPTKKESMIYDRERAAFMGPWKTPWGITHWLRYFDATGTERYLAGTKTGPYTRKFDASLTDDSGTAVSKIIRTKTEEMGDWSVLKTIKLIYVLFRNVRGTVTVNFRLEGKTGVVTTSKSFNITSSLGTAGWGTEQFGSKQWGQISNTVSISGDELVKYSQLFKIARTVQLEVITTASNSNFEFLSARITGQSLGDQSLPATARE
jgi:hypothetical protein